MRGLSLMVMLVALVAGCSATPAATPSTPQNSGTTGAAQPAGDPNSQYLERLAEEYDLDPVPEVSVVKVVSAEERVAYVSECLAEQGFVTDGTGARAYTEDQKQAYGHAEYVCSAKYPLAPEDWGHVPSQDERIRYYHYWVDVLTPCYEDLGYEIPDPPSLESWLSGEEWAPYYYAAPEDAEAEKERDRLCPIEPPDSYG